MRAGFGENMVNLSTFSTGWCGKMEETGVDIHLFVGENTSEWENLKGNRVGYGGIMSFFGEEVISIFHRQCGKAERGRRKKAGS